ncbi:MAG: S8 family serine peptidase [Elainellaceae cyanobacterium]
MVFQQRQIKRFIWLAGGVAIALIAAPVTALMDSVGEAGIDARRLHESPYNLTGEKIAIGQVEIGRPAVTRLDKTSPLDTVVRVRQVFFRDLAPTPNELVDGHAANVASVMISQDKSHTGVAPNARLYSSAVGILEDNGQPEECLASQTVASQNGDDVRAINFSFGESLARDPRPDAMLDGNALLTQCIDWSSNAHGVLYVIAGNQGRGGIPIPTDNFNGMNVSNSTRVNGEFTKVDYSSLSSEPEVIIGREEALESNVGPRRSLSLVAPGTNIEMFNPDGRLIRSTGTSFAAPHVTAAVALIQEYGDRQLRDNAENWSLDSRNPQVSKAILMNSADKVEDQGDGRHLGMSRTLLTHRNLNWVDLDAYSDPTRPLSAELGTGHLNAYRAVQQFSAGQWSPDAPVPVMGWDYRSVASADGTLAYRDYVIDQPLEAGSYLSATLAWNRLVELKDDNGNERYDIGESFDDRGLNNLNLYLMRADDTDTGDAIWSSVSEVDSVEHIFHQVPATGRYKIRVVYAGQANEPVQPYALAWWAKSAAIAPAQAPQ